MLRALLCMVGIYRNAEMKTDTYLIESYAIHIVNTNKHGARCLLQLFYNTLTSDHLPVLEHTRCKMEPVS